MRIFSDAANPVPSIYIGVPTVALVGVTIIISA